MTPEIHYGKAGVTVYRTAARPLAGIRPIPESPFSGRTNELFAARVDVDVLGDDFLPAYTEGDNSNVVATDTMKNFIHAAALAGEYATLEGLLAHLGRGFLESWTGLTTLRLRATELPFLRHSPALFRRAGGDAAFAELQVARDGAGVRVSDVRSGREGLHLVKLTGSSFTRFVRDAFTTLPETTDRPLYVSLDTAWRYTEVQDAIGADADRYVDAEQVRDLLQATFDGFVSRSIQHLVHELGQRVLARFPQLAEVSFEAENRTWDTAASGDGAVKVYTDPRAMYGRIGLVLRRDGA